LVDNATNESTKEVNVTAEACPISPILIDMLLEEINILRKILKMQLYIHDSLQNMDAYQWNIS